MGRTNIDIDDELIGRAMSMYGLRTKREAVHLALTELVGGEPMSIEEQLAMEGVGWEGDLDAMRAKRFEDWGYDEDFDAAG
ncbi:type II toxin-antitoxin system VapB family antitoxin [Candidatus Poriferisodalis sp.]|uniref:type II toxin-antitoxin system VapB family antitoxin n=1 Tax=Candidatus Poriferisodalis sp. TaxID=3101277 RepID=UPI003C6F4E8C